MSEEDRSGQDAQLGDILQQYPVVVTMLGAAENKNEPINPGATIVNSDYLYTIPSVPGIIANVPDVEFSAFGSGITNSWPEVDGVTRRIPLVVESGGTLYPNVTMEVLRVLAGDPSFQIKLSPMGVDKLRIPAYGIIQTSPTGEVWIDWSQRSTAKQWPNKPLFYACCPSKTDPSVAPENKENLFFLIPIAPGMEDTEEIREKYFSIIMKRFEDYCGQDVEKHIEYKRSYCIKDFIEDYNSYKGNAYGLANTLSQTANLKPKIVNKNIKNLFYTGHFT